MLRANDIMYTVHCKVNSVQCTSLHGSLHRLVLSIELGTVKPGTAKVDPARKPKRTTAARDIHYPD